MNDKEIAKEITVKIIEKMQFEQLQANNRERLNKEIANTAAEAYRIIYKSVRQPIDS